MKKKLLFTIYGLNIGGDVASLIALLHTIDYNIYEVDLLLLRNEGDFIADLPNSVNLLPPALGDNRMYRVLNYLFRGYLFKSFMYSKNRGKSFKKGCNQIMAYAQNSVTPAMKKEYDVAIGYVELWPDIYVATKVNAKRKIGWVHVDYEKSGFDPELDKDMFSRLDKIVCVSDICLDNFRQTFSELSDKTCFLDNITSEKYIKQKSNAMFDDIDTSNEYLKIVTVARLHIAHKGLDRGIIALKKLISEGYKAKWYIIGEGQDREILEKMIWENNLEDDFILLGKRVNPYPYIKNADVFVMTSRFEGKPIAVTESQILGIPVISTEYASANEQIRNSIDGIVVDNTDEAIYYGIKTILDDNELLHKLKLNLSNRQFSNEYVIDDFYRIIEG